MRRRVCLELLRYNTIDWQHDLTLAGFSLVHNFARGRDAINLRQRLANLLSLREQESICHSAANNQRVDFLEQVAEQVQLGRNLGAADNRGQRPLRMVQRMTQRIE